MADSGGRDFFMSYTAVNRPWREWIAVQLEAAGGVSGSRRLDGRLLALRPGPPS